MYFLHGEFDSREDYLVFVKAQDVANATIQAASQSSETAVEHFSSRGDEEMYNIHRLRSVIRKDPFPANATGSATAAAEWFNQMSSLLNHIFKLQARLLDRTGELMQAKESEDRRLLAGLGALTCVTMLFCPSILNGVRLLTDHMHKFSLTLVDR
jgi:hypothetical protein